MSDLASTSNLIGFCERCNSRPCVCYPTPREVLWSMAPQPRPLQCEHCGKLGAHATDPGGVCPFKEAEHTARLAQIVSSGGTGNTA